jgi:ribosomal protein S18 acetylase RimI-like enzyme
MASGGTICYFKRYRMEADLHDLPAAYLPPRFACQCWAPELLEAHAQVLYDSFFQEIDAHVFPSLSSPDGCRMLMMEISRKWGFLPRATWLLVGPDGPCGTVQGVRERSGLGAIQNLGIVPSCRGRGLGRGLLLYALHGFWASGLGRALLEVTAQNEGAIHLYHRLGFRRRKTLYKAVADSRVSIPAPLL